MKKRNESKFKEYNALNESLLMFCLANESIFTIINVVSIGNRNLYKPLTVAGNG